MSVPRPRQRERGGAMVRVLGSLGLAIVVVLSMLLIGLQFYEPEEPETGRQFVDVTRATPQELRLVRELLGQDERTLPEPPPPPPPVLAPRQINGFVQLAFTVQPDGTTRDVEVLAAVPEGVYETRAVEEIRNRRYPPRYDSDGRPMPSERNEVVHFSVEAQPQPREGGESP